MVSGLRTSQASRGIRPGLPARRIPKNPGEMGSQLFGLPFVLTSPDRGAGVCKSPRVGGLMIRGGVGERHEQRRESCEGELSERTCAGPCDDKRRPVVRIGEAVETWLD